MEIKETTKDIMYKLYNIISLNPNKLYFVKKNLASLDEEQSAEFNEKYAPLTINTDLSDNHDSLSGIMSEKNHNDYRACKEYNNYDKINDASSLEEESYDKSRIKKAF